MTDWRHQAACRSQDPELFFPIGDSGPALLQAAEAKAVCNRCPAAEQCLQWALTTNQDTGIWGGYDEAERRRIKRGRSPHKTIAECGTRSGYKRHKKNRTAVCRPCAKANSNYVTERERQKAAEKQRLAARDAHIVRMADRGLQHKDIAIRAGVSKSRVTQILREVHLQRQLAAA